MTFSITRRRFVELAPLAGAALTVACSPPAEPPAAPPAPATAEPPAAPATGTMAPPAAPAPPAAAPAAADSAAPMLDEKDPQAVALGYVADAARADKAKFPAYVAGSTCSNCTLYLGKAGEAAGGCPLFAGKNVAAAGWCSSWVKKA
jgi:hypothetical protein